MTSRKNLSMDDHDLLVTLDTKMDAMQEKMDSMYIELSKYGTTVAAQFMANDERMREMESIATKNESRSQTNKEAIENMERKSNVWDVILGVGTFVGTIIGAMFGRNP